MYSCIRKIVLLLFASFLLSMSLTLYIVFQVDNFEINDITYRDENKISIFQGYSNKTETIMDDLEKFNFTKDTELKIYIYDLPENLKFEDCLKLKGIGHKCVNLSENGYGKELYKDGELYCHNTWQFSLEKIIHHKLMSSRYRSRDFSNANMFYIPFYAAVSCFCHSERNGRYLTVNKQKESLRSLIEYLENHTSGAFKNGLRHVITLGKIEREHMADTCPILLKSEFKNMTVIGIEESSMSLEYRKEIIVVPYPSYAHFGVKNEGYLESLFKTPRTILAFFASGDGPKNDLRKVMLSQYANYSTELSYDAYMENTTVTDFKNVNTSLGTFTTYFIEKVRLITRECAQSHTITTLKWMKHSLFCLQPPGDSPTRKSFYDAIMSGCIPVIFKTNWISLPVKYPFETWLNYTDFTITLDGQDILSKTSVIDLLKPYLDKPHHIIQLQNNVLSVIRYLQYGRFEPGSDLDDAMGFVYKELKNRLKRGII